MNQRQQEITKITNIDALQLFEWKFEGEKARERPKRIWAEDLLQ